MLLILASESPRRRELLTALGLPFQVERSEATELTTAAEPRQLPILNAERKAAAVAEKFPAALVIGADTIVLADGRIIGKPKDLTDARQTLLQLAGRTHEVITGVALLSKNRQIREMFSVSTKVRFKSFGPETADRYLSLVSVLDKAGAYAIQEHGELLVDRIDGELDNVVGLPCQELAGHLKHYGF